MPRSYGWAGQVLWVDLKSCEVKKTRTEEHEPEKFIGGMGLNTKIFWDLGCPRVPAFDPTNPLIASVGPLTGTVGPFQRAMIGSISPQAYPEELFSYSSIGGRFPSQLKYAGYDGLVVTGRAEKPVYLSIHDEDVQILDAADLWGADALSTGEALAKKDPTASALCIGISGENLSRLSAIVNNTGSTAGEGGFGAVMGSKNLKAIRVRGTGGVHIARPDEWLNIIAEGKAAGDYEAVASSFLRQPLFGGKARDEMSRKYRTRSAGCVGCPYQCNSRYKVPGLGSAAQFCASLGYHADYDPDDPKFLWEQTILEQTLCLDSHSVAPIIGFLYECRMEGILNEKDFQTLGISMPPWLGGTATNHEFLTTLLYPIAEGTGIFANGLPRAMEHFGKEAFEIYRTYYTARGFAMHWLTAVTIALHWALDTRDPAASSHDHLNFNWIPGLAEHFGVAGGPQVSNLPTTSSYEGFESTVAYCVKHQSLKNSLPWCEWQSTPEKFFRPPDMDIRKMESRAFSAVTGIDTDPDELWRIGERIWNLRRAVMVMREDRTRKDDTVDNIHFEKQGKVMMPIPLEFDQREHDFLKLGGPLNRKEFEALKDSYYALAGWDLETGRPTRARLESLELGDVADKLQDADKLPDQAVNGEESE